VTKRLILGGRLLFSVYRCRMSLSNEYITSNRDDDTPGDFVT